jgi:hypothetical protein
MIMIALCYGVTEDTMGGSLLGFGHSQRCTHRIICHHSLLASIDFVSYHVATRVAIIYSCHKLEITM